MKLRNLLKKVASVALACAMLTTTMPVLADEVTDKLILDIRYTEKADGLYLSTEDNEALWKHLGATTITDGVIPVLDENSGLYVDIENSVIKGFAGSTGTALNNVYMIELYGISVSRNDEGNLEFDEFWHTYGSTECIVDTSDYSITNVNTWDTQVKFENETVFNYPDLARDLMAEKGSLKGGYYGNDIFHVRYYYADAEGNGGWYGSNFLLSEQLENSVFNFVEPEVPEKPTITAGWKKDSIGWWYQNADGTYPANCWKFIGNKWYAFNKNGYMREGWFNDGGTYYYLVPGSGYMATGWINDGGTWYYMKSSGAMAKGWVNDGGTWYYMKSSGAMAKGWVNDGGTWYYMKSTGAMATGWIQVNGTWYYLYSNGAMAKNTWIGSYYVNANGAWID